VANTLATRVGMPRAWDIARLLPQTRPTTPLPPTRLLSIALSRFRRFPRQRLRTLRFTHGSHLIAAGMELPVVSERLGHSKVRVTDEVYTHAIRGWDDEAARRWENYQT